MKAKLLVSTAFLAASVSLSAQKSATITVHADQGKEIIPKEIYGQFAEHLGSCIYGGLWVGENSDIPNIKGYRTDVFNKRLVCSCSPLAGRLLCRRISLDGRYRSQRKPPEDGEQQLGRND